MAAEDKEKDSYIRIRIDTQTKEKFQELCKKKAINSSALIRQLIEQWNKEQENTSIQHNRTNDIK